MPIKVVELRGDHGDDPDTYVISTNIRRRHLNHKQREEAFAKIIARAPEKSDRQIAREIGVDHKTIGRARAKGEDVGSIPHVPTRTDSKGRRQPARKPERRTVPAESQKRAARQVAKRVAAAIVESEVNEVARLRARVQELEAEVDQLKRENLDLQSEVDELRGTRLMQGAVARPLSAPPPRRR
jgi:cell division protein FtsL